MKTTVLTLLLLGSALALYAFTWPWEVGAPWPSSSDHPVERLDHPTLEDVLDADPSGAANGYRFVVFGDQRALADGEWQLMNAAIRERFEQDPHMLFIMDTGDIVYSGRHSDQFHMLKDILEPISLWPYLVAVGNHELNNLEYEESSRHTFQFLSYLDPAFSEERRYYRKDVGPVTFLFLDSNPWIYELPETVTDVTSETAPEIYAQFEWLQREQTTEPFQETVVAAFHHPFIQTSKKHRKAAQRLWDLQVDGTFLPEWLLNLEIDALVVGHTHTYERFSIRHLGRSMQVINVSGRPRTGFLWIGDGARRAKDIRGEESEFLREKGFSRMEAWDVVQEDVMVDNERNQFMRVEVAASGMLTGQVHYVDKDGVVEDGSTFPLIGP